MSGGYDKGLAFAVFTLTTSIAFEIYLLKFSWLLCIWYPEKNSNASAMIQPHTTNRKNCQYP